MRFAIAIAILFFVKPSFAVLGQKFDTVAQDKKVLAMKTQKDTTQSAYDTHEMTNDKMKVREFTDPSGTVFAVAWDGRSEPDLNQLLGSYFPEYQKAFKDRHKKIPYRTHAATIQTENVIVKFGGHFGALRGKAYAPSLIPAGVNIDEIK